MMSDEYIEIREQVKKLCSQYPGEYWRELDTQRAYPTDFVRALTEAGYLSVLIPEQYGGSGLGITAASVIMEEIQNICLQKKVGTQEMSSIFKKY